jgi:hypothetical protein
LISCNNYGQSTETPTCIEGKIREIKNEGVRNPPGSIWQYKYNGNVVYYIPAHCCDQPSELFDANCNFICSPDGGFAGNGDGKCPDFFEDRSSEKLIWKDLR